MKGGRTIIIPQLYLYDCLLSCVPPLQKLFRLWGSKDIELHFGDMAIFGEHISK